MVEAAASGMKEQIFLRSITVFLLLGLCFALLPVSGVQAAQRMSVKVSTANVRSGPSKTSAVSWQVTKYHPFQILKKKGDWYECKDFEGDTGWLYKDLLVKTGTVITLKNDCNIRSGPGSDNHILFKVDREVPLKVIKRKGRWLKIEHEDGDQGWIHASLVW